MGQTIEAAGVNLYVTVQGDGPLVILMHGWPELALSWRHQIPALVGAGYRVAVPDMRGYGASGKPADPEAYTLDTIADDMQAVARALGAARWVAVGHDWGAPAAWRCALRFPDAVAGVFGLSVPHSGPPPIPFFDIIEKRFPDQFFYMRYFQTIGVAEDEFARAGWAPALKRVFYMGSGEGVAHRSGRRIPRESTMLASMDDPPNGPLPFMSDAELDEYAAAFAAGGFRGPLNWYRNFPRNAADARAYGDNIIGQPAGFLAGDREMVLAMLPGQLENMREKCADLRMEISLPGAGHWVQQERPAEVNAALLGLPGPDTGPAVILAPFRPAYAPDDEAMAAEFLGAASLKPAREARVDAEARRLIGAIRQAASGIGGIEALLREYSLSTPEGLALMVLAEGLLRVPDDATADRLIEDKLGQGGFAHPGSERPDTLLVGASAWALGLSARLIGPSDTPEGILRGVVRRLGLPTVRGALRQAMRVMGSHFVLGQTIDEALARAGSRGGKLFRYSFDMLGEGARTADDAAHYQASYAASIESIGRAAGNRPLPDRPGISVKLSALHPRYEAVSRARVMDELVPRVQVLARAAAIRGLNFTVDAEEADRLELSLDVIEAVAADRQLAGWDGFGLAVQSYGKRAREVIDRVGALAETLDRRFMVRLVKGAYWDTEVKRAQERGLPDYPVFTRKPMTDLSYMACAERLLAQRPRIYPQFATHNALTVASVIERAGDTEGYEFQRLHGMGDALYAALLESHPGIGVRTYAPVGVHKDLLAYLVRRLLENGANSSFVSVAADADIPVEQLLRRPGDIVGTAARARHAALPLPSALFGDGRRNSAGVEFGHAASLAALCGDVTRHDGPGTAAPVIDGAVQTGVARAAISPVDGARVVGQVVDATPDMAEAAMRAAQAGSAAWQRTPAEARAAVLEKAADLLEAGRGRLLALLADEGGKTLDDGVAEIREAVDFLRYYAAQARALFGAGMMLPGPTGERNTLRYRGRGVFLCISPWNFPLAIFLGQVGAALAAGNSVVAKPAEQTPLVAAEAVRLLHQAGVPPGALHLVTGDGAIGARLVADARVAGVAFTGSTPVAWAINRALAAKDGPIVPLIAETGGINAMIVDATALPEQVVDDAVMSAFRSAGQRCSALRLLCVQEDVADRVLGMLVGAARELRLGDPRDPSVHIGPVVDAESQARLLDHIARMKVSARTHYAGEAPAPGFFVAPHIFEIDHPRDLAQEIFGPVLHVVRYRAAEQDALLDALDATGYGLTLGIHTRIDASAERIAARLSTGNIYVNRNMIGAVVGVQPFGGSGLSGTGPKAGGPDYLRRFGIEQTVSENTAAAGGNAALLAAEE